MPQLLASSDGKEHSLGWNWSVKCRERKSHDQVYRARDGLTEGVECSAAVRPRPLLAWEPLFIPIVLLSNIRL